MKYYLIDLLLILGGLCMLSFLLYMGSCSLHAIAKKPERANVKWENCPDILPVYAKARISSGFGIRRHPISRKKGLHTGIDFKVPVGTPVKAAASGIVQKVLSKTGKSTYGRYVIIGHDSTYSSLYAHLSRIVVEPGQDVKQGDVIAFSGNSGYTKGPHLHYEIIKNGIQIDPMMLFE